MWLMADKELVRAAAAQPSLRCEATLWQFLFPVSFDKQSPVAAGTSLDRSGFPDPLMK